MATIALVAVARFGVWHLRQRVEVTFDDDVFIVAIPVLYAGSCLAASLAVALRPARAVAVQGALRGALVGSVLFLPFWTFNLVTHAADLMDGVGYWAGAFLPAFYIGLPFLAAGALLGAKLGGARLPRMAVAVLAVLLLGLPGFCIGSLLIRICGQFVRDMFIFLFG